MTTESSEPLPKTLPGTVHAQWKRCGRPGCRCARGQLHGPYYFRFWRQGGKLRKVYVPRRELDDTRACCQARRDQRAALSAGWAQWRDLAALLREVEAR